MARRYARDNKGRFASTGSGATARGGRLKTASGNKRQSQTMQAKGEPKGTIGKPKGLKPGAISGKLKPAAAANRAAQLRQRAAGLEQRGNALMGGGRQDRAATNVSLNSRARRNETNAGLRGLGMTKTAASLRSKADRVEERAQQSAAKALRTAANPKRTRSNESMRLSRAKQVEKRRGMNINNPAAWRQESAGRMAANAKRTQERALAFYKGSGKAKPAAKAGAKTIKPLATPTKLGPRINPANKANRAATAKFNQAYNRENRIRSSLFQGNKSLAKRQAITNELNKASNLTATMQQQRREVRARFQVQTKSKLLKVAGSMRSGTMSQNKDVRNANNRREAFKRKVNRAGALSRPGTDKKAQRTAQVRAKAMATYQGTRRPELADSTVGRFGKSRTSTAFKAPASRLAPPSQAARRQGRALTIAQKPIRDQFGRRIGNPKKQQRSKTIGARAISFYQNPKAAAESVLRDRGKRGLSTRGFKMPRQARRR